MPLSQVVSVIGSILLLSAYAGMQTGHLKTTSYVYQFANFFGAAFLTYSVIEPFNTGVFMTEFLWSVFSLIGIYNTVRILRRDRTRAAAAGPANPDLHGAT